MFKFPKMPKFPIKITKDPCFNAFRILQFTFIVAPLVAGLDKFFNLLTNWSKYISLFVLRIVNFHDQEFMMVVGVIEIIAAIGIFFKPRIFAYVITLWLLGIIINLLLIGKYYDIALRDLGLLLASLALGSLSQKYSQ